MSDIEYINDYLAENERTELLKFLTCGSVDDGKSTLIGRLLYDSNKVYEDHLKALIRDSRRLGHDSDDLEFALLADGLKAEQEQGITIDVAYRYFATSSRKYIIADCPGHSQYTKNMATGASNCQLAVILIDAQNGVLDQTRRHSLIVDLLGIRQVVVAINKMDLVSYDKQIYERIRTEYLEFAEGLGFTQTSFVPVAAKFGENVVQRSTNMDWYTDDTIIELLERHARHGSSRLRTVQHDSAAGSSPKRGLSRLFWHDHQRGRSPRRPHFGLTFGTSDTCRTDRNDGWRLRGGGLLLSRLR